MNAALRLVGAANSSEAAASRERFDALLNLVGERLAGTNVRRR